jgi:hypothetical protein
MEKDVKVIEGGQVAVIAPKIKSELVFCYSGTNDLEKLISFVGVKPVIEFEKGKIIPLFKKIVVSEGSYVFRNSFGEVRTMNEADFLKNYDVQAVKAFSNEYANKLQTKEVKVKADKK